MLIFFLSFSPFKLSTQEILFDSEPLSSEDAFQMDYIFKSPTEIVIRWKVHNSYYLYKEKFSFSSKDYFIDEVKLPIAKIKDDERTKSKYGEAYPFDLIGRELPIEIKGNLESPSVSVDLSDVIKHEVEKLRDKAVDKIKEKIEEKIKLKLPF